MVTSLTSFPRMLRMFLLTGFTLLTSVLLSGQAVAAAVTATLEKSSIPAGEPASLSLEITNGNVTGITPPTLPDVTLTQRGHSSSTSFINGRVSSTITVIYLVESLKPGDYTIPPFSVMVDGVEMKTAPLKLKVTASSAQAPQGLQQGNTPPGANAAAPQDTSSFGFVTVEPAAKDRNYSWVGEIAPVRIKAWVPVDAQVTRVAKIQPGGSAFTLHNLSEKPEQKQEIRNGRRYTVLTYYAGLSATKAGIYVPDLTLSATAVVRDTSRRRPRDPFDDPFAGFFAPSIQKDVELKTLSGDDSAIEVRALPLDGRPADFNGAVGKFSFEHLNVPNQWQTGEPQSVSAVIGGEGNFNLLAQPEVQPAPDWKCYTGQSEFTPKDAASFSGSQSFRFTAMPRKGGPQKVQLAFSYFDPATGRYESVMSPLQNIEVRGADLTEDKPAEAAVEAPKKAAATDTLAPLHAEDTAVRNLLPLAFRPAFKFVLGSTGALLMAGLLLGWARSVRRDPARTARELAEKAEREAMHEAESFAARGDTAGFFAAARRALQVKLAAAWSRPAQAITLDDVTARVPADSPLAEFFREADRVSYSPPAEPQAENLTTWRARLREALQALNPAVPG
ncbi:MAG TPA: BatD family protein [Verrucomicrobiales bacterium]|nr:BatD family protein [Verrucomicrobiales bacterium]